MSEIGIHNVKSVTINEKLIPGGMTDDFYVSEILVTSKNYDGNKTEDTVRLFGKDNPIEIIDARSASMVADRLLGFNLVDALRDRINGTGINYAAELLKIAATTMSNTAILECCDDESEAEVKKTEQAISLLETLVSIIENHLE